MVPDGSEKAPLEQKLHNISQESKKQIYFWSLNGINIQENSGNIGIRLVEESLEQLSLEAFLEAGGNLMTRCGLLSDSPHCSMSGRTGSPEILTKVTLPPSQSAA